MPSRESGKVSASPGLLARPTNALWALGIWLDSRAYASWGFLSPLPYQTSDPKQGET